MIKTIVGIYCIFECVCVCILYFWRTLPEVLTNVLETFANPPKRFDYFLPTLGIELDAYNDF